MVISNKFIQYSKHIIREIKAIDTGYTIHDSGYKA